VLLEKFNLSIPKTDSQKIIETIENLINKNINPNFISNLTQIKDGISLELLNKVNIKVIGENTINKINIIAKTVMYYFPFSLSLD